MYTNETLYNALKKAIIAEGLANELPNGEFMCAGLVGDVMEMLKSNLQEEIAKKGGGKVKHLKILKQVLEVNQQSVGKERYMNAIPYKDNRYFFTNGYECLISCQDYGYAHSDADIGGLIETVYNIETDEYPFTVKVDMDNLKLFVSTHKKEKQTTPYVIPYGDGQKIGVCPKYLLRCLQWAETDTIHIRGKWKPVLIKGETNRAILFPMKLKDE